MLYSEGTIKYIRNIYSNSNNVLIYSTVAFRCSVYINYLHISVNIFYTVVLFCCVFISVFWKITAGFSVFVSRSSGLVALLGDYSGRDYIH